MSSCHLLRPSILSPTQFPASHCERTTFSYSKPTCDLPEEIEINSKLETGASVTHRHQIESFTLVNGELSLIYHAEALVQRIAFHEETVMIDIKGPRDESSNSHIYASGIYFSPSCRRYTQMRLPGDLPITTRAAEIHAAIFALTKVKGWMEHEDVRNVEDICETVIMKTDSNYLARNMNKMVWIWEESGYVTFYGASIPEAAQLQELHRMYLELENWGITELKRSY
jgi:ribonuclease HI